MIVPSTDYAGQIETGDAGYPHGKAKNVVVAGDGSGTPLERNWLNDIWGWFAAFLDSADITPSGTPEMVGASDMLDAFSKRIGTSTNLTARNYRLDILEYSNDAGWLGGETSSTESIAFSEDGTKMYMLSSSPDSVFQYTLSVPWSAATAVYASITVSVGAEDTTPRGLAFSPDGLKMYVAGAASDAVHQYTLGTAWNVSTATADGISLSLAAQETNVTAIAFSEDGTKLYAIGTSNGTIFQYTLPTPWTLAAGIYSGLLKDVTSENGIAATGLAFNKDGKQMFMVEGTTDLIYSYTLGTPWQVSTATVNSNVFRFGVSGQEINPREIEFSNSGGQLFLLGGTNDEVFEYISGRMIT